MKRVQLLVAGGFWMAIVGIALTGCETTSTYRRASSVVKYLYPKDHNHIEHPAIPVLSLPLRVGIAFVPEDHDTRHHADFDSQSAVITEEQKVALMKKVSEEFKQYPFVHSIQIIPSSYLLPGGGFANLDQIREMFDLDVIALVSYDQVQFRDEGLLSLTYWTVLGAYVVPGEKNDTQTMMDTVVYDLASRKLLFRAPGISKIKGAATPINLSEEMRHDSERGFRVASVDLIKNLDEQLAIFKDQVKKAPEEFKIETKPGYTKASVGSFGPIEVGVIAFMAVAAVVSRRRK